MTITAELLPDSLTEVPATGTALWLPPSDGPRNAHDLFRPQAPFRRPRQPGGHLPPVVVTRDRDVREMLLDESGLWLRYIPESIIPRPDRHCVVDAHWMLDGQVHKDLRRAVGAAQPGIRRPINRGSTADARRFTFALAQALFRRLTQERWPWNLMRVIDEVSLRTVIEHTLKAPVLLTDAVRIRELTRARAPDRDDYSDVLAYFTTDREPEFEDILALVPAHPDQLAPGGLARHLVNLTQVTDPETGHPVMTGEQLISELGMLVISYESTSAMAASLIGMLLQYGLFDEARQFAAEPGGMRQTGRRGRPPRDQLPVQCLLRRPANDGGQPLCRRGRAGRHLLPGREHGHRQARARRGRLRLPGPPALSPGLRRWYPPLPG